jgi:hypothetical protein
VYRVYEASVSDEAWEFSRDAPEFSQRFTDTFEDGGDTILDCRNFRATTRRGKTTCESRIGEARRADGIRQNGKTPRARRMCFWLKLSL